MIEGSFMGAISNRSKPDENEFQSSADRVLLRMPGCYEAFPTTVRAASVDLDSDTKRYEAAPCYCCAARAVLTLTAEHCVFQKLFAEVERTISWVTSIGFFRGESQGFQRSYSMFTVHAHRIENSDLLECRLVPLRGFSVAVSSTSPAEFSPKRLQTKVRLKNEQWLISDREYCVQDDEPYAGFDSILADVSDELLDGKKPSQVSETAFAKVKEISAIDHAAVAPYLSSIFCAEREHVLKAIADLRSRLFDGLVLLKELQPQFEALLEMHRPLVRGLMSTSELKRFESSPVTVAKGKRLPPVPRETYRSAFISYGAPDEAFAERLHSTLASHDVKTFFFRNSALPGQRLHRLMSDGVNQFERVILICSKAALNRPGVLNELEQVLAREAREGGTEILIPVRVDEYVFSWQPDREDLARQIRDRVVADFSDVTANDANFNAAVAKLLAALKK